MRQDQGRAWRGACKTFATLAAEVGICANVSTANKARMKDLTVACRENGHSCPCPHRPEQESPCCTTFPGSCRDRDICSRALPTSQAVQEGAQAHGQFLWQRSTKKQESAAQHPTTCAYKGSGNLTYTVLFLRDTHHMGLLLPKRGEDTHLSPRNTARALTPCFEGVQVPGMFKKWLNVALGTMV